MPQPTRAPLCWLALCIALAPTPMGVRAEPPGAISHVRPLAGHAMQIQVRGLEAGAAETAIDRALAEAERVAALLWLEVETSEIGILNHVPMGIDLAIAPETAAALQAAIEIAERTEGAYDPTSVPLLALWGLDTGTARVPRQTDIDAALRKIDWENIELGDAAPTAARASRRMRVDLGPVAIGAVLDAALAALRDAGAPSGHVATRDVQAVFGGPWMLIADESAADDGRVVLERGGLAFATPRQRLEATDDVVVHERIDPRTGRPADALRWVVVVAPDARSAAGYASAVFVLGAEAQAFVEGEPELRAILAPKSGPAWRSPGLPGAGASLPATK